MSLVTLLMESMTADAAPQGESNRTVIALVDDDRNILTTVSIALQGEGFATRVYSDGEAALGALLSNPPDLAIFDIKMPKMDGMELLRRLREQSPLPVIFLTSKDDETDEQAGFEMGADDYIAKPFSLRLLLARIRAILRRSGGDHPLLLSEQFDDKPGEVLERGRLFMDPARHHATWDGEPVSLTVTEFLLLEALATRPGVIKSRNQLMDAAYPCLLYTSPSPRDATLSRMPSSA